MKLYKCPKCKDTEQIDIAASIFVRLIQPEGSDNLETDTDEAEDHSHEWDLSSLAICWACNHSETVDGFLRKHRRPKAPRPIKAPKLTKAQTLDLLLDEARAAQTAFWDALRALETESGLDIEDTNQDLENVDIKELRRQARRAA